MEEGAADGVGGRAREDGGRPFPPVFDGHIDTLLRVRPAAGDGVRSFLEESERGHVDLPRARRGGLAGAMLAVCVPRPHVAPGQAAPELEICGERIDFGAGIPIDTAYAHAAAIRIVERLYRIQEASCGTCRVVRSMEELRGCLANGTFAAVLHLEGAEPLGPRLEHLEELHRLGLRSAGIVWSRPSVFGHGVPFVFPGSPDTGPGLTDAGKALVRACNACGIVVDLAHINARGFDDAAACTAAPLVVSHTAAHALCPSPRNLTDAQLAEVGRSGGVVGVTFHPAFLRADGRPDPDTRVDEIVRHVRYIADLIGVDHVALGSDFDGAVMPAELGSAAALPALLYRLRSQGFDDDALARVAAGNWLRVLGAAWREP